MLRNILAVVAEKPEFDISARPLAVRSSFAARSFALESLACMGSGAFAGAAFALSDVFRASTAGQAPVGAGSALAIAGLWIWFGVLVGLGLSFARILAAVIKPRLPSWLAWRTVLALTAGAFAVGLARKMLAGPGAQRSVLGSWGAWVLPVAVACLAWVALWLGSRFAPVGSRGTWRRANAFIASGLAIASFTLDARTLDGYLFLHILLLAFGLVLATEALEFLSLPLRLRYSGSALALVTLPMLVSFPTTVRARELLGEPTWAGRGVVEYAQLRLDFDHDGHSAWFGGGDCNDRDASVYPGAPETPGDGRDSNCDGSDDPTASSLRFAPFQLESGMRVQELSERATHYPTVVLLIDALRFDRVGDLRFPNLAQLSRESIRFTHMYAASSTTLSSVPAMLTGIVQPTRSQENIAQSLTRANQRSLFIAPDVILEHFEQLGELNPIRTFSARASIATDYRTTWLGNDTSSTSNEITARAVASLEAPVTPGLVWLHYFDVHQWDVLNVPGTPPHGDLARYDRALDRLDESLRPLLELRDRVNIVLLADHGEGLGARGVKNHTSFVFEELAHVPFLIRIPSTTPSAVEVPVASTCLFNTLRALRGLEPDLTVAPSLLNLVGQSNVGNGPGFAGFEQQQWSLLYGNHRLLYMPRSQLVELYDVARDPREQRNLATAEPEVASQMLARLFQLDNARRR